MVEVTITRDFEKVINVKDISLDYEDPWDSVAKILAQSFKEDWMLRNEKVD